jgi:hypothetical protein
MDDLAQIRKKNTKIRKEFLRLKVRDKLIACMKVPRESCAKKIRGGGRSKAWILGG